MLKIFLPYFTILIIHFPLLTATTSLLLITMAGLKCSVCNYITSNTISDDSDITSKIKVLEIHSNAAHQVGYRQDNAGEPVDQQVGYRQDNGEGQVAQQVDVHQVGYRQDNVGGRLDQSWMNQSFPDSNPPIVQVPNDATAISPIFNIPHPNSSNEFEKVLAEPPTVTSKDPKNVETAALLKKRKITEVGNKEKKGRYDEDRELNTPSPPPAKPPTPCYSKTSLLSCMTEPVESPPSSPFSSTYADDGENNKLTDDDVKEMLDVDVDDEEDEDDEENGAVGESKDYSELFNESDSFVISDHESLRRSLKFQTFLRVEDRIEPSKFGSFMTEFAQKMRALNNITMESHKAIDKEHQVLFGSILVNHFSKWTGLSFLNEAEIKKKNNLEISIKNFDSRILGEAKITKGKKK